LVGKVDKKVVDRGTGENGPIELGPTACNSTAAGLYVGVDLVWPVSAPLDTGEHRVEIGIDKRPIAPGHVALDPTGRADLVIVLGIHEIAERDLLHVGDAHGLAGFFAGLRKNREEDCCQNCDDGDYN